MRIIDQYLLVFFYIQALFSHWAKYNWINIPIEKKLKQKCNLGLGFCLMKFQIKTMLGVICTYKETKNYKNQWVLKCI